MSESLTSPVTVVRSRRFRWRGPVGVVLFTPTFLITLFSTPLVREDSWLGVAMNALAWASFVAGAAFRFWATLYIGGRKDKVLMREGPYSICRHPLYVGSLLLAVATGLFLKSVVFAGALVLVALVYMLTTVPVEESFIRARLPDEFDRYRAEVPRFLPRLSTFHTPPRIDVDVHALRLECARASRWVWLPLLGVAVSQLRSLPWWPHLFTLP